MVFLYLVETISRFLKSSLTIDCLLKFLSDDLVSNMIAGVFTLSGKYQPSGLKLIHGKPS